MRVYTHTHVCTEKDLEGFSEMLAGPKGFELCVRVRGPTTVFLNPL